MVNRNLIRSLENDPELSAQVEAEIAPVEAGDTLLATIESETDFDVNMIVDGRILHAGAGKISIFMGRSPPAEARQRAIQRG